MGVTVIWTDPIQTVWAKIFWKGICDADLLLHLRVLHYSAVQPMSHIIQAWGTQHLSWLDGLPSKNGRKIVCDYCTGIRALGMHRWKTICIFWKVEQISSQSLFRPRNSHCRLTNYVSRLNPEMHSFISSTLTSSLNLRPTLFHRSTLLFTITSQQIAGEQTENKQAGTHHNGQWGIE